MREKILRSQNLLSILRPVNGRISVSHTLSEFWLGSAAVSEKTIPATSVFCDGIPIVNIDGIRYSFHDA